jgi:hypothetical protein
LARGLSRRLPSQQLQLWRPPAARDTIRDVSELAGFPSRAPRRWRTGRNTQLNLKVSADVLARFTALADQRRIPFGALLEQLLDEVAG